MNTDRNLLFGVLALQTDLIDSSQFADACAAWAARKNSSLADILIERGWITAADKADVERLMERKLKRHGGDLQATLDAVADAGVREAMLTVEDTELRRTIALLSSVSGHILVDPLAKPSESHTRYTLTRLHGQGGLGRVWVARDNDLNREVALKELQEECAENPVAKSRFLKEAQITGQLEHPNIVPVYELGRRGGDQPFYTMRFLRGQTLRHAISDYHKKRKDGADDPLELRRLLGAFVGVCHALAYAHSRGVVHRDVKPSNIAMGDFGEVVLLDWGLAKIAHAEDNMSATLALSDGASGGETLAGRALGTPSYMAPEQAQGQLDLIGPPTDIYGLGSTLFHLISGKPPHKGESTAETLDRIIKGETPRARTVEPSVPPALDAICATAMAKSPSDRYAKASDLAEDIQRWLADEPVSCLAEPLVQRAARWARRHRTWTKAALAALLVVTGVSIAAAILINRSRQQADTARLAEASARTEATQLFREARAAVDTHLREVSEVLRHFPGVQRVRETLLRKAADDYERFAQLDSFNLDVQVESGRAFVALGDVRLELGELLPSEQAYRSAEAAFERLSRAHSYNSDLAMERGNCRTKLGIVLKELGRYAEADQIYRRAVEELETLAKNNPHSPNYGDSSATALVNRAHLLKAMGQHQQAEESLNAAIHTLQLLADEHTSNLRLRFALASARLHLADLLTEKRNNQQATTIIGQAIESIESLVTEDPGQPDYLQALADGRLYLARVLRILGRDREEREAYETAIDDYRALLRAVPDIPDYRENLAVAQVDLALLLHALGHNSDAKTIAESTLAVFRELVAEHPRVERERFRYRQETAESQVTLGQVLSDLGQNADANAQLSAAVRTYRDLNDELDDTEYLQGLALSLSHLGQVLHKQGQHAAALEAQSEAIENLQSLVQSMSSLPQNRDGLAWCYVRLGDLLRDMNKPAEATEAYRQSLEHRAKLADEFSAPEYLHNLGWLLANCADEDLRKPDQAVAAARRATDLTPESSTYWNTLGVALYRAGKWDDAIVALRQAEQFRSNGHALDWFFLAMAHWQKNEREKARKYSERAIQWMDQNVPDNLELRAFRTEVQALLDRG